MDLATDENFLTTKIFQITVRQDRGIIAMLDEIKQGYSCSSLERTEG